LREYDHTIGVPIAQELVKSGKILSFSVTRPMFVGASTVDHDYTVTFGVASYEAAMTDLRALFREVFGKTFPNKNWNDTAKLLSESRQHVRDELWRLMDTAR
jgi:hypothetical protein